VAGRINCLEQQRDTHFEATMRHLDGNFGAGLCKRLHCRLPRGGFSGETLLSATGWE